MTAPEKPDALRIARWAWGDDWRPWVAIGAGGRVRHLKGPGEGIHAAEQVAVERGHRDRLYEILYEIVWQETDGTMYPSRAAFAPLEARALALLRLVEELEGVCSGSACWQDSDGDVHHVPPCYAKEDKPDAEA